MTGVDPVLDAGIQRMLTEQLTSQLASAALPMDGPGGQFSTLFAQVLADAVAPAPTDTETTS